MFSNGDSTNATNCFEDSSSSSKQLKFHSLSDSKLTCEDKERLNNFVDQFKKTTNNSNGPDYIVKTPGRVNLIGDHIDYHGFGVLPMAIEKSIWFGFSVETDTDYVNIFNSDAITYPNYSFKHTFSLAASLDESHPWQNYILCGYHGVLTHELLSIEPDNVVEHSKALIKDSDALKEANDRLHNLPGMTVFVDSDLPEASGMSSSSALVCASAVATLILLDHSRTLKKPTCTQLSDLSPIERCKIGAMCSKFEHLIGTRGGGMDQAVIMTADKNFAKYVKFEPSLECHNLKLPSQVELIISHCGDSYQKAATKEFNARVLETKLGAAIIAKRANLNDIRLDRTISLSKIRELLALPSQQLLDYVTRDIFEYKEQYLLDEVCDILCIERFNLVKLFNIDEKYIPNEFRILKRVLHVISEAERVEVFKSICEGDKVNSSKQILGELMTLSHKSLQRDFDCSTDALDRIVLEALDAGALGCRLTGAGFGGCTVTLVESCKSNEVFNRLKKVSSFSFRTEPQSGCKVFKIK